MVRCAARIISSGVCDVGKFKPSDTIADGLKLSSSLPIFERFELIKGFKNAIVDRRGVLRKYGPSTR